MQFMCYCIRCLTDCQFLTSNQWSALLNMEESEKGFDLSSFYAALAATVKGRGITWKQASQETGVGASTLTRMAQGRSPDAASLATLSAWAGLNPAEYVRLATKRPAPEP